MNIINLVFVLLFCTSSFIKAEDEVALKGLLIDESEDYDEDATSVDVKWGHTTLFDRFCNKYCKGNLQFVSSHLCASCYPVTTGPATAGPVPSYSAPSTPSTTTPAPTTAAPSTAAPTSPATIINEQTLYHDWSLIKKFCRRVCRVSDVTNVHTAKTESLCQRWCKNSTVTVPKPTVPKPTVPTTITANKPAVSITHGYHLTNLCNRFCGKSGGPGGKTWGPCANICKKPASQVDAAAVLENFCRSFCPAKAKGRLARNGFDDACQSVCSANVANTPATGMQATATSPGTGATGGAGGSTILGGETSASPSSVVPEKNPEMTTAKADMTTAKTDMTTAKAETTTAKLEMTTAKLEMTSAKTEISTTKTEDSDKKTEDPEKNKDVLKTFTADLEKVKTELKTLTNGLAKNKENLIELEKNEGAALEALANEKMKKQDKLNELTTNEKATLTAVETALKKNIITLNNFANDMRAELEKFEKDLKADPTKWDLFTKKTEIENAIKTLKDELVQNKAKLMQLTQKENTITSKVTNRLMEIKDKVDERVITEDTTLDILKTLLDENQVNLSEITGQEKRMGDALTELDTQLKVDQEKVDALPQKTEITSALSTLKGAIKSPGGKLSELKTNEETALNDLKNGVNNKKTKLGELASIRDSTLETLNDKLTANKNILHPPVKNEDIDEALKNLTHGLTKVKQDLVELEKKTEA